MKVIVLLLLGAIVASLCSALFFLVRGEQDSAKLLRALRFRIGLSMVLIVFLVTAYLAGWIA